MKKIFLALILLLFCAGIALLLDYRQSLNKPQSQDANKISFQIKKGEGVDAILKNLIDSSLLNKRYYLYAKVYLKLNDLEKKLQAGLYELPKNLNMTELFKTLQDAKEQDIWVTIPEGLRKDEVATILDRELSKSEKATFSQDEFLSLCTDSEYIKTLGFSIVLNDLEGFLFPDKYAFSPESTTKSVLKEMTDNFKKRVGTDYKYEDIVMASIVEREGFNSQDRPIIAGILLKRLREGWLLQADATLLYLPKDWKHIITDIDKKSDNPYNTYKKIGLPPTPICNPGLQAIEASLHPEESPYYFYIHDKDGVPHYGVTLSDHNNNVTKYLR